jgi:hypothetical protein
MIVDVHPTLRDLDGPPAPRDMEYIAVDLLWFGKFDRCAELADTMMAWWQASPYSLMSSERFYYWLGIRCACMAVINGKAHRAELRAIARFS